MSYTATPDSISHLAYLVHQARPEWDQLLVRVILHSHAHQVDGTDLAIAALRCAANDRYSTPKAIGWRGPHWDDLTTQPAEHTSHLICAVCGLREPDCQSRPGIDDDHDFVPRPRPVGRPTSRPHREKARR